MNDKNVSKEESYWNDFYSKNELAIPSQFCALFASEIGRNSPIVEFGCGNGRDSLFLARHGYQICAVDLSATAIEKCKAKSEKMEGVTFKQGDVSVEEDVRSAIDYMRKKSEDKSVVVYSRFFLHSIDQNQEHAFLSYLSKYLIENDKMYLEFRSKEDEDMNKIYGSHYRRYIDTDIFIANLEKEHGFNVSYSITGQGVAKYKSEDPMVTRIIATKRG